MSTNKTLRAVDRKLFKTYFEDGLVDIFLAAWVLMFAIGPLLSGTLGDFWSSVVFLPFWGVVYLILRYIRKRVISPRIGSVKWGAMRTKKLRVGIIVMMVINLVFLGLGIVSFLIPIGSGWAMSIRFGVMMLIIFSAAGFMLDFNFLYVYGVLAALAMPVGEWLYQKAGFSHHGYPVVFGCLAGIMFVRGLVTFITFLKTNPDQVEEPTG
jgi:MFS family permease